MRFTASTSIIAFAAATVNKNFLKSTRLFNTLYTKNILAGFLGFASILYLPKLYWCRGVRTEFDWAFAGLTFCISLVLVVRFASILYLSVFYWRRAFERSSIGRLQDLHSIFRLYQPRDSRQFCTCRFFTGALRIS